MRVKRKGKFRNYKNKFFPFMVVRGGGRNILMSQSWLSEVYGFSFDNMLEEDEETSPLEAVNQVRVCSMQQTPMELDEVLLQESQEGTMEESLEDEDDIQVIAATAGFNAPREEADEEDDLLEGLIPDGVVSELHRAKAGRRSHVNIFSRLGPHPASGDVAGLADIFGPSTELS